MTHSRRPTAINPGPLMIVAERLTAGERAFGRRWYADTRERLLSLGNQYGIDEATIIAATAVMSPGLSWPATMSGLAILLDAHARGAAHYPKGKGAGLHLTFGYRGYDRAWAILNGADPAGLVKGMKVEAFRANLSGDLWPVTVDRHVLDAAGVYAEGDVRRRQPTVRQQREIVALMQTIAPTHGLKPAELQAAIFVARAKQ